ncbi:MAG: hypothetical protein EOP53_06645 [Sphingobacteriales bacterium]|nr:MAG: hypothetical protein EOP53_06645 [Sphingobacteriales bacterium]
MKKYLLFVPIAVLLGSCATPKIALQGDGFTELPVKGRNGFFIKQKLSFGDYKTTSVKRSWTKGSSSRTGLSIGNPADPGYENIISMEYTKRKQTVNFGLTDGTYNSEVRCVTKFSNEELIVGNNENSLPNIIIDLIRGNRSTNTFYVQVFTNNETKPWHLLLDNNAVQQDAKTYVGKLALDDNNYYSVVPVNKMLNKNGEAASILFGSIGLDIRNKENKSVATVSFLNNGKVYLNSTDKKEAFLLSNVCAALLLQQQIEN